MGGGGEEIGLIAITGEKKRKRVYNSLRGGSKRGGLVERFAGLGSREKGLSLFDEMTVLGGGKVDHVQAAPAEAGNGKVFGFFSHFLRILG